MESDRVERKGSTPPGKGDNVGSSLELNSFTAQASLRSASPQLHGLLQSKNAKDRRLSNKGPRRALSMLPAETKKLLEVEPSQTDVGRRPIFSDWHIAFEKLKLGDLLGRGTFKVVYRGTYLDTNVAIAEILSVKTSEFSAVENELNIMQHIRHPNALLFIGVAYTQDRFFIVTELAPMGTMEHLLKEQGANLSWKCKLWMANEIAHALSYLHERGVYHRDLKAENVLVFPGDNDGYLLKLGDFGLGFLNPQEDPEWLSSVGASLPATTLTDSHVGTVWIRAPEVDMEGVAYDPAAVDVFSLGMVFVDLLTNGGGEDMRWEVATQKRDPLTGKALLAFGLDSVRLHALLSRRARPAGLVGLATECCAEHPLQRPQLPEISKRLAEQHKRAKRDETVRAHLQGQLKRREASAVAAIAAIKSEGGVALWAQLTGQLARSSTPAGDAWRGCCEHMEQFGPPLNESEKDVLAEAAGYDGATESIMNSRDFALLWEQLEPITRLLRNPQIAFLWRSGCCLLLCDRNGALAALVEAGKGALVLRISTSFAGKLTLSTLSNGNGKPVHQIVTLVDGPPSSGVVLGKGADSRTFQGLHDLLLYCQSNGYSTMVGRGNTAHSLEGLIETMPRLEALAETANPEDGYDAYS